MKKIVAVNWSTKLSAELLFKVVLFLIAIYLGWNSGLQIDSVIGGPRTDVHDSSALQLIARLVHMMQFACGLLAAMLALAWLILSDRITWIAASILTGFASAALVASAYDLSLSFGAWVGQWL